MTARFRPVWLVLDPFTGGRVPLGALVETQGVVAFVAAPSALRLGVSSAQRTLVDLVLADLEQATTFEALPFGAGPQVVAGEAHAVPASVRNPTRWVAERVLGQAAAA